MTETYFQNRVSGVADWGNSSPRGQGNPDYLGRSVARTEIPQLIRPETSQHNKSSNHHAQHAIWLENSGQNFTNDLLSEEPVYYHGDLNPFNLFYIHQEAGNQNIPLATCSRMPAVIAATGREQRYTTSGFLNKISNEKGRDLVLQKQVASHLTSAEVSLAIDLALKAMIGEGYQAESPSLTFSSILGLLAEDSSVTWESFLFLYESVWRHWNKNEIPSIATVSALIASLMTKTPPNLRVASTNLNPALGALETLCKTTGSSFSNQLCLIADILSLSLDGDSDLSILIAWSILSSWTEKYKVELPDRGITQVLSLILKTH